MKTLLQDIRYALRMLVRNSGFSMIVMILVSIGIGVSTTVFTLLNTYLFRPLPYEEGRRIVLIMGRTQRGDYGGVSYPDHLDWRHRAKSIDLLEYCRLLSCQLGITLEFFMKSVQLLIQLGLKFLRSLTIDPCRSAVLLHPLPG